MSAFKRAAVIAFTVLITLALLSSAAFIAAEANHDCSGDECLICARIEACVYLIKTVLGGISVAVIFTVCRRVLSRIGAYRSRFTVAGAACLSKVKLLN